MKTFLLGLILVGPLFASATPARSDYDYHVYLHFDSTYFGQEVARVRAVVSFRRFEPCGFYGCRDYVPHPDLKFVDEPRIPEQDLALSKVHDHYFAKTKFENAVTTYEGAARNPILFVEYYGNLEDGTFFRTLRVVVPETDITDNSGFPNERYPAYLQRYESTLDADQTRAECFVSNGIHDQ